MNSLEYLKQLKDYIPNHEYESINKDLEKLQAIESADLNNGLKIINHLKEEVEGIFDGFGLKLSEIAYNKFKIIENTLKKSKLLESKEKKIKEYIIKLIKRHNHEMYNESITSDIGNVPTLEYKKRMMKYFERKINEEIKEFEVLLGGESNE